MALTKKQIIWGCVCIIPIIGGGYMIYKQFTNPASTAPNGNPKAGTPVGSVTASTIAASAAKLPASDFPLQSGSGSKSNPNKSVMALQTVLGVAVDGIFGPKTLAALQAQTGVSVVNNNTDLQTIITTIGGSAAGQSASASPSNAQVSNGLSGTILFNATNGATQIWVNVSGTWAGVDDNNDVWIYNNNQYSVTTGNNFSITSDFVPVSVEPVTGWLIVQCVQQPSFVNGMYPPTGNYYLVDPATITVS